MSARRSTKSSNMEPWVPFLIAGAIFVSLAIVFAIAKTFWYFNVLGSYILSAFTLVAIRRFQGTIEGGVASYVVDGWFIAEATIAAIALVAIVLMVLIVGFKVNNRHTCCYCLRMQRDIEGIVYYDDIKPLAPHAGIY